MLKWSSPCCSVSLSLILVLLSSACGQQKNNAEFKHQLPDDVELVDPKSLGLTDADLTKFLGNVKVLGGGQIGDTKTQILSVGFEGDENINFNDFVIPGLTDGKNSSLPEKDKEIADIAFKRFKEFFADPKKARTFEDGNNLNLQLRPEHKSLEKPRQNNVQGPPQNPNHFHIPMIQKPYTTPRVPTLPVTTHHPSRNFPSQRQPPPPPPQPHQPLQQRPPQIHFPQPQNHPPPQPQQSFNSQIKSPPQRLEFGARIPVSPNPQPRPHHQVQQQIHSQNQGQFQKQNQEQFRQQPPAGPIQHHQPQQNPGQFQHHRLVIQHQPQQNNQNNPQLPQPHIYVQPPAVHHFPQQQLQQQQHQPQQPPPPPLPPQAPVPQPNHIPQPRPQPLQNIIIQHPITQQPQPQPQLQIQHRPQPTTSTPPAPKEQGRIVRNQLLQLESNHNNQNINYLNYHTPPQLRPPPPPQQTPPFPSATNQVPVHAQMHHSQPHQPAATATSHVYIQTGSKTTSNKIQHTPLPFHPQFVAPSSFAKDFTPAITQITTSRPIKFNVTPGMKLIPLSTNENAITDPTRMLQLRLYQQQKAQAQAQASSNQQTQTAVPQQPPPTPPPSTTPIISITTSYPEVNQFSSSSDYQLGSQSIPFDPRLNNQLGTGSNVFQNNNYNNKPIFPLQAQTLQNHNHQPSYAPQGPSSFYSQDHRRPPREGQPVPPPRFQFHVAQELGQPPRFHMYPDPKNMLNSIRRKRGYRRLSDLFNRMFRWERN